MVVVVYVANNFPAVQSTPVESSEITGLARSGGQAMACCGSKPDTL